MAMFEMEVFEKGLSDERRTELIDEIAKKIVSMGILRRGRMWRG